MAAVSEVLGIETLHICGLVSECIAKAQQGLRYPTTNYCTRRVETVVQKTISTSIRAILHHTVVGPDFHIPHTTYHTTHYTEKTLSERGRQRTQYAPWPLLLLLLLLFVCGSRESITSRGMRYLIPAISSTAASAR